MSDSQPPLAYESMQTPLSGIALGTIGLQLLGVYCIALALPAVTMLASFIGGAGAAGGMRGVSLPMLLLSFVPLGSYIVMGVLLIRFAPRISMWLFRDSVGGIMAGPVAAPTGRYLQAIAFSIVGVVTMINAAPRLVSLIWMALMDMGAQLGGYSLMIEPIVQFLAGLALFLQSKGLSLLWHKIRTGGVIGPQPAVQPVHSESEKA